MNKQKEPIGINQFEAYGTLLLRASMLQCIKSRLNLQYSEERREP